MINRKKIKSTVFKLAYTINILVFDYWKYLILAVRLLISNRLMLKSRYLEVKLMIDKITVVITFITAVIDLIKTLLSLCTKCKKRKKNLSR